jgi:hypothetical protein
MKPKEPYLGLNVQKNSNHHRYRNSGPKGEIRVFGGISSGQPFENDHIDTNRPPVF